MKVKPTHLENLIKEEIKIFFENHGSFPVADQTLAQEGDVNEMKSDLRMIYQRLLEHLGGEKLLEELVKNVNPRMLREAMDIIAKTYSVKLQ